MTIIATFCLFSCTQKEEGPEYGAWGVDLSAFDHNTKPGDDFYKYVNGVWIETVEIPETDPFYGTFVKLNRRAEGRLLDLIDEAISSSTGEGSNMQKVGDYYTALMDIDNLEANGLASSREDLEYIASLQSHEDVARAFMRSDLAGDDFVISISPIQGFVGVDIKNTTQHVFYLRQSGLGLPSRNYYLRDNFSDIQNKYRVFLEKLLALADVKDAPEQARAIYDLEANLAEIHWPMAKRRDTSLTHNPMTIEELSAFAPGFAWAGALDAYGVGFLSDVVLIEKDALRQIASLFSETPVETWRAYLLSHYLINYSLHLPPQFASATLDFYVKTLRGSQEEPPRKELVVDVLGDVLGFAIGEEYVARYFPEETKRSVEIIAENIREAFHQRIAKLSWMSEDTKTQAREKVSEMAFQIGYPDRWKDYSTLSIERDDALGNYKRFGVWKRREIIAKLDVPVDRNEWTMHGPQEVNGMYHLSKNMFNLMAGMIEPPFFDPNADAAVNYGAIGMVIGHETSHAFDSYGSKFDARGNLRDWWTPEDAARFDEEAALLVEQYGQYSPLGGVFVNGENTLGENIADLVGLAVAYDAYKLYMAKSEERSLDGLTSAQRFFIGFCQSRRAKYTETEMQWRLENDTHSPEMYRCNGAVRNIDAWYDAFDVRPGDVLYLPPDERVRIW